MARVNRSLKDKAMDHIDHALGRPADPFQQTHRNYFATDTHSDEAHAFRRSEHWQEQGTQGQMVYFCVTDAGRAALKAYLKQIGDTHREFIVSYDDQDFAPRAAKSRNAARYDAFLTLKDGGWLISFRDFCKRARVRRTQPPAAMGATEATTAGALSVTTDTGASSSGSEGM